MLPEGEQTQPEDANAYCINCGNYVLVLNLSRSGHDHAEAICTDCKEGSSLIEGLLSEFDGPYSTRGYSSGLNVETYERQALEQRDYEAQDLANKGIDTDIEPNQ